MAWVPSTVLLDVFAVWLLLIVIFNTIHEIYNVVAVCMRCLPAWNKTARQLASMAFFARSWLILNMDALYEPPYEQRRMIRTGTAETYRFITSYGPRSSIAFCASLVMRTFFPFVKRIRAAALLIKCRRAVASTFAKGRKVGLDL